jgi:hypothetical protein
MTGDFDGLNGWNVLNGLNCPRAAASLTAFPEFGSRCDDR